MSDRLDPEQRAVMESPCGKRVVVAGPGSGKTTTLIATIRYTIEVGGVHPEAVVAITYTVAAAKEIKDRLRHEMGDIELGYCGTLHGFLYMLLGRHGSLLRLPAKLGIADEATVEQLLQSIAEEMGCKASLKKLKELAGQFESQAPGREGIVIKELFARLRESGLLTFDTILTHGLELLRTVSAGQLSIFPYEAVFWDELQDANEIDFDILEALPCSNILAVGDGDQSIYGFRGAAQHRFTALAKSWTCYKLERNYRSGGPVCYAAQRLIEHDLNRVPKKMKTMRDISITGDSYVRVIQLDSPIEELGFVAAQIARNHASHKEQVVICRTNAEVQTFTNHLRSLGIPVRVRTPQELPADWNRTKLFLGVLAQQWNNLATYAYIRASEGKAIADKISEEASLKLKPISSIYFGNTFKQYGPILPDELWFFLEVEEISPASIAHLKEIATEADLDSLQPTELLLAIGERERREQEKEEGTGVTVCTVHAAKGREWDEVFIVGCEERKRDIEDLAEARRLYYVAITRARYFCHLSWCSKRPQNRGPNVPPGPLETRTKSRFLGELGL